MALVNIQTVGDEAIFVPWPGYTGTPTPTSGKAIDKELIVGKQELRRIYQGDVTKTVNGVKVLDTTKATDDKIMWAHKWRLNLSGEGCSFTMTSNDTKFTQSGNVGRCKNGKTITVTVTTDSSSGRVFKSWSDGSTDNPRTFIMTDHKTVNAVTEVITHTVRFFRFGGAEAAGEDPVKTMTVQHGALATPPSDVSILGWTFNEWYSLGRVGYISYPITEDTDFYGDWRMQLSTDEVSILASYGQGSSNTHTEIYNYRKCRSSGPESGDGVYWSGRTFVVFNKDTNDKGRIGYDLPIGSCVSAGIEATIRHRANPTNHYISIVPCLAFSLEGTKSYDKLSFDEIRDSFSSEFPDNIYDFSGWDIVTAPKEVFTLCVDGETADTDEWNYWSYDSASDEYIELDVNDGDPVGGYHKTPKKGNNEFTIIRPASGEANISKGNGYIVVDIKKLTKSELKDMGITDGASCSVPWYVTMTLKLQLT